MLLRVCVWKKGSRINLHVCCAQDEDDDVGGQQDDNDDDVDDVDSADEYDEELYKGPADRAEMDRKSDLEREMILADRHDRKQRRMETLQVRAEMRQQLAASKQQSRRTARAASSAQDDKKAKLAELALKRQQSENGLRPRRVGSRAKRRNARE